MSPLTLQVLMYKLYGVIATYHS